MTTITEEIYSQEYFNYLYNRSRIRKLIRKSYLKDIRKKCVGKTIDFGCGTGDLLKILPTGSIGFEVNKIAVEYCQKRGLQVYLFVPEKEDCTFQAIEQEKFQTFTMNHVLEHLKDANEIITKIFESCNRLGIVRIVFTIPGRKGFLMDKTHETFIDLNYFRENDLLKNKYYKLTMHYYFPFNLKKIDRYFRHNELRLVFDKRNS